jgi:hypothetical protein
MTNEMERRVYTAAQIAHYGSYLGLLRYQIDDAVCIGISRLDDGDSATTAYEAGRKAVDKLAGDQIIIQAQSHLQSSLAMRFNR